MYKLIISLVLLISTIQYCYSQDRFDDINNFVVPIKDKKFEMTKFDTSKIALLFEINNEKLFSDLFSQKICGAPLFSDHPLK